MNASVGIVVIPYCITAKLIFPYGMCMDIYIITCVSKGGWGCHEIPDRIS
tara:strand:+ start:728 stop:877 length:150 start_codon:yes stop_codon:yes gene_type:complete